MQRERKREDGASEKEPWCHFPCDVASARVVTVPVCLKKKKKLRQRHYFHFYSRAAQHPPQSARWPKPCANPRSCSLMCPRKHARTHTRVSFCTTDFDVTNAEHIFLFDAHAHTGMRLYFVHRDIRINRFVKLGLSSHIHRNHGIRCVNALCS